MSPENDSSNGQYVRGVRKGASKEWREQGILGRKIHPFTPTHIRYFPCVAL